VSSSPVPCQAIAGDRTDKIQACSRTEKRTPHRSLPDRMPRVNDHRDMHEGPVPGSRRLPCHNSTDLVLYSRMPQPQRRSSPWLNRSRAEGKGTERPDPRTAHPLRNQGRTAHACRRHVRPHHDQRVMLRLWGPPETSGVSPTWRAPHKNPTSTRPGPAPTGIPLFRRSVIAESIHDCQCLQPL
jgi:hypothetical protein